MGPVVIRRVGWERILEAALADHAAFRWGRRDCCLWAANVVRAMTGIDPAVRWRGYRTRAAAEALMAANGGVEGLIASALAGREVAPTRAQRGDVVLLRQDGAEAAGVVALDGRIATQGRRGIVVLPRAAALRAWRI